MRLVDKIMAWRGNVVLGLLGLIKFICNLTGFKSFYKRIIIRMIKPLGLFDRGFYLENNNDVHQSGQKPLRHYVYFGDREGRSPMPLFDPGYYRSQVPKLSRHSNCLLHYAYVGRHLRISPSPWFDIAFYLSNNKDVARSQHDPLVHYLKWGGFEGRSPCPQFDGPFYLQTYPDVVALGVNPLMHYLFSGRLEGRRTLPDHGNNLPPVISTDEFASLYLPDGKSWQGLQGLVDAQSAVVSVVIPVYKGRSETLRCIQSVLTARCRTLFHLVVINDASPDPELVADLKRLAELRLFTLLANDENRGFVHTVNKGMMLDNHKDIVLLNSDTEVYEGWLDRLHQAAHRNPKTGTVTPLSNNATICSYPRFLEDNPYPLELSFAEMDCLTASINEHVEVEAPTGVGFCMYIKRACLQAVGLFDEKTFGKGYGEENDFCQRAIRKGWRNIIAADVFVRHLGSASFQGEKAKRVQDALKILDKRYPRYRKEVARFIKKDPMKEIRCRLDAARMKRMCKEKNVLIVCHNRGGGSERRVQEDIFLYSQLGFGVFILRPVPKQPSLVILAHPVVRSFPNINPFVLADTPVLAFILKGLKIDEIHTHSLVDYSSDAPALIKRLAQTLAVPWKANLHDYKVICPRINLVDENGLYCGEPAETECNRCLSQRGSDFNAINIRDWRNMHAEGLAGAKAVILPDKDMADRLARYFPAINFTVEPHEAIDLNEHKPIKPRLEEGQDLRIVVIGAIGKLKGFHAIMACAKEAKQLGLPLDFTVMGYTMNDKLIEESGVTVTGQYHDHEALAKLNSLSPHVVWLPSLWPETYSYTLSIALKAKLPVFAFDIGAIARRLKEVSHSDETLMPLSWHGQPTNINHKFLQFRNSCILPLEPEAIATTAD